jgi:hypothetical protein
MYPYLAEAYGQPSTAVVEALAKANAGVPSTKSTIFGSAGSTIGTILPYLYLSQMRG